MSFKAKVSYKKALMSSAVIVFFIGIVIGFFYVGRHNTPAVVLRANACLARLATSASSSDSTSCFTKEITNTLKTEGLSAAFGIFKIFYDNEPLFRGSTCHDAGHILGAAAYSKYMKNHEGFSAPEASYCGYGFYHGFMEQMFVNEGQGQYEGIRSYCASLGSSAEKSNARAACDHGIGHALFDLRPASLFGKPLAMVKSALDICEAVLPAGTITGERIRCSTGVFNSLANAMSAKHYGLNFTGPATLSICTAQQPGYQPGCFTEVGIGVIRNGNLNRAEALSLINSLADRKNREQMLMGYVSDEEERASSKGDFSGLYTLCGSVGADLEGACTEGVITGMKQGGSKPGQEYTTGFDFCKNGVPESQQVNCYVQAIDLGILASDSQAFKRACLALPATFNRQCIGVYNRTTH